MNVIQVSCVTTDVGWRCDARVDDGRTAGTHAVTVRRVDAERLTGRAIHDVAGVEGLVRETFAFLLDREPESAIMASFDITVVSRYFPEYGGEIRSRQGA